MGWEMGSWPLTVAYRSHISSAILKAGDFSSACGAFQRQSSRQLRVIPALAVGPAQAWGRPQSHFWGGPPVGRVWFCPHPNLDKDGMCRGLKQPSIKMSCYWRVQRILSGSNLKLEFSRTNLTNIFVLAVKCLKGLWFSFFWGYICTINVYGMAFHCCLW